MATFVPVNRTTLAINNVDNTSDATKNTAVATLTNKTLTTPVVDQFNTASGLGAAWSSWTPTLSMSTGVATLSLTLAQYKQIGKTVNINIVITVTAYTSTGIPRFTLPVTPASTPAGYYQAFYGRENQVAGKMLQGIIDPGDSYRVKIWSYDNVGAVAANSMVLILSGTYEAS